MTDTRFHAPERLDEAIGLLTADDEARPLAGGQTLVAMLNAELLRPRAIVSLHRIAALKGVERRAGGSLWIGAMTTHSALAASAELRGAHRLLAEAAARIGHEAIRNRGTIGGAVAHADPSADYPAALVALDAEIEIEGPRGKRSLPAHQFFRGFLTTALEPGELVTGVVLLPGPAKAATRFEKLARVEGDFATASVAVVLGLDAGRVTSARLTLGGCGSVPIQSIEAEQIIAGHTLSDAVLKKAGELLAAAADPIDDVRGTAAYRRAIIPGLVARAVRSALAKGAA